jgi:AraC family transcriptional activator FtrA
MSLHRVAALVLPPQSTFELACAAEVFGMSRPGLPARYAFTVCAEHPGPVPTLAGYDMLVSHGLDALEAADTVVVPGWRHRDRPAPPAVTQALRRAHRRGARIVAICSGAFLLAAAGLLDGRRATTHWRLAAELAGRFPAVEVEPDTLYVDLGDVATSAGTAAGIDLCLHLVRTDHGASYAAQVARHMVMPPHREGGQVQYAAPPARAGRPPESLAPVLDWALARLHEPLGVEDLAARAGLSPRTLARRFAEQLGVTPGRWLLQQRVAAARTLLEETDLPVETIAARVGLSSAANLRRRFRSLVRTTPAAYRRSFGTADRRAEAAEVPTPGG